jgi:hypothetical protein
MWPSKGTVKYGHIREVVTIYVALHETGGKTR